MKTMRERNQVMVALVGTAIIAGLVLLATNLGRVPLLHRSETYHAQFADANGLKAGDDVRVQGISVGSVRSVKVHGAHVRVDFTVKSGLALGDRSAASIEMATVLGNVFLQVESSGSGRLHSGDTIPLARTRVPFTVIDALGDAGSFAGRTDLPTLRRSLKALAAGVSGISRADADAALRGLADVASTVSAKQQQISQILDAANTVIDTLNRNSRPLVSLLVQADQFLALLNERQQAVAQLLRDTSRLGSELSRLITGNQEQLTPLLANLDTVTRVLARQKTQLQRAVAVLGQFSVNITDATGSGPWIDLLSPTVLVPDNVIAGCGPHPNTSAGPCR